MLCTAACLHLLVAARERQFLLPDLTITRDKIADKALLSPELLFPDLNVFARKMLYDSQGLQHCLRLALSIYIAQQQEKGVISVPGGREQI